MNEPPLLIPCSGMSRPSLLLDEPILYLYDTSYCERAESTSSRDAIRSRASIHFAHERATPYICSQMSHPSCCGLARWYSNALRRSLICLKTGLATRQYIHSTNAAQQQERVRVSIARKTIYWVRTSSRRIHTKKLERDLHR